MSILTLALLGMGVILRVMGWIDAIEVLHFVRCVWNWCSAFVRLRADLEMPGAHILFDFTPNCAGHQDMPPPSEIPVQRAAADQRPFLKRAVNLLDLFRRHHLGHDRMNLSCRYQVRALQQFRF